MEEKAAAEDSKNEKDSKAEREKEEAKTETLSKKAALQPKFDTLKSKVDQKKDAAAALFKNGSYAEAINLYKQAATLLDDALDSFAVFRREIAQMEATIFNNIAFCYGKDK